MNAPAPLAWTNRFARLGENFFTDWQAQPLPDPHWVAWSDDCAAQLGWGAHWREPGFAGAGSAPALAVLAGQATWPGMRPGATVYSGHQFGVWAGQLGDGRALWLGEVDTPEGPREIQLKGSGRTPFSRMGDGRAVLRSSIREFLCSEAMHGLGIPTTRALGLVGSSLPVRREQVETAAVVARVAPSFVRFGHFEHFAHHGQHADLRRLLDQVLTDHYPELQAQAQPALALLEAVALRTAHLIAQWQAVGFCHGVLNTDNLSILGLTLDYGPFGFLDAFDPGHICNHSDDRGRYAFARQPQVGWWNLTALAQALVPLVGEGRGNEADVQAIQAALSVYGPAFSTALNTAMRAKLGLTDTLPEDAQLVDDWLRLLHAQQVDYTIAMRRLAKVRCDTTLPWVEATGPVRDLFMDRAPADAWLQRYTERLRAEHSDDDARAARMNRVNPMFVLRNHLAEQAIQRAQAGDFSEVQRLHRLLSRPYDAQPEHAADAGFPPDWARQLSVSCSS